MAPDQTPGIGRVSCKASTRMPSPTDFSGIQNRDATASIRGYVYQIYQSVLAWIFLGEDDVLILEGAEDFDVHSGPSVVATQIKNEAGTVTLRSRSVLDSIKNFWTHQQNNDEFRVFLRFLTTAEAGCEKGAPFGSDQPGLEYWRAAAQNTADCELLRQFLLSLSFDGPLLDFIRSASDVELRERLLARIQWDLGARDKDALEAVIENKLKVHGFRRGVGTHHSIRVLPHLLKQVADLLSTDGTKRLCFGDFLSSFDEATTEIIPRGALEALQNMAGGQRFISMQDTGEIARLAAMPPSLSSPLPIVAGAIRRTSLVKKIAAVLTSTRVVFLHGSSGVGKTNLASLVTGEIGGAWVSVGFRGRPPEQVQQGLARAGYEVGTTQGIQLVLDDLEFGRVAQFERELIALICAVTQRNGLVLVTGIARPPLHLFSKLWLPAACEESVPYFDESEVSDLLADHGLSDVDQRSGWARVIFLSTSGHPQLAHARARTLSAKGWPSVSFSDLTKSEDVERVREEARARLLQEFPSDATRRLAYRLSLVIGTFSRRLALAVGNAPEAISMPGEAFDHLVGPWIEREGEGRFRVSPLLGGAAENILTPAEIKAVHVAIAHDFLNQRTLNQYEVGTAFFHALMAKDFRTLAVIAKGILTEDSAHIGLLYDAMTWFPHISLEVGQHIVENNSVDMMLRLAQFKLIIASGKTEDALKIIDRAEELLAAMKESDQKKLSEAMAYGSFLNTIDLYIPSHTVVRMLSRLIDTATTPGLKDIYENLGNNQQRGMPRVADNRPEQLLFSFQAARIRGLDDLATLVTAMDELPDEKRNSLLAVCEPDSDFAALLVGRAWWNDVQDGSLDVGKAVSILQSVESTARRWGTSSLVLSCQVAISVIHDEYGDSVDSALAVLDSAEKEFPNSAELINQRAKVLFRADREEEALSFAERALSLPGLSNVAYVYTCRSAGIAAANLGNWERAVDFFELGAKRAFRSDVQKPMAIGLSADAAIGYWNQDKRAECILKFSEVLDQLESAPHSDDLKLRHLHATVRHCISWIHFEATRDRQEQLATPRPGMCSNQDPHEGIKDHRIVDISAAWFLLRKTEEVIGADCGIRTRAEKFSDAKQPLIVASYKRTLDFEASLRTPPWEDVVTAFVRMREAMHYSRELDAHEREDKGWQPGDIPHLPDEYWKNAENWWLIHSVLLAACLNCLARHPQQCFPVEQWRTDLALLGPLPSEISVFLDVLNGSRSDGSLYQEVGTGLVALHTGAVSAETLWKISFRLLNAFEQLKRWAEEDIEVLATSRWIMASDNQRFAFSKPSLAIPAIKAACEDETRKGLAKVAEIVAVAAPYLSIRMAPDAKAMLERIAAGSHNAA